MRHILVVDDDRFNLRIAKDTLSGSYEVSTIDSGEKALIWLENNSPDMILMDIEMKGMSGIEAVRTIKSDGRWTSIPIAFLTATIDPKVEIECLQAGADDFITKPFVPTVMKSRVDRIMELYELRYGLERELMKKTKQVEMVTMHSIMSIANTIDAKDKYTSGHSVRVAKCAVAIARRLGWTEEEQQNLQYVALLHDIGKIGVPDAVLKKPDRLDNNEFDMIKKHPLIGGEILKEIYAIPHVREGALFHHEKFDGTGYPYGLKGKDIPLYARIVCIADTYDAMSSDRVYRKKIPTERIIEEYERCKGIQFDPNLADIFIEMLREGYSVDDDAELEEAEEGNEVLDTVLRECLEEATNISMIDSLTGLYNRAYAQSHVEEYLKDGQGGTMFMMDLDNFKHINDAYGHIVGDQVLRLYAGVLRKVAGAEDILCRVGGDEFIMFLPELKTRTEAAVKADSIIRQLMRDVQEAHMPAEISTSIGIAFARPGDDFNSMYGKADKTLYFTKRSGKNNFHFYETADESEVEPTGDNADVNNIRRIIQGKMDFSDGAFNLAYGEFQKVYNFIARYLRRGNQEVRIMLMTLQSNKPGATELAVQEEVMGNLEKAISAALRQSDVYTRYSSSQYVVILMDTNDENGEKIAERIRTRFRKLQKNDDFDVQSDLCEMEEEG